MLQLHFAVNAEAKKTRQFVLLDASKQMSHHGVLSCVDSTCDCQHKQSCASNAASKHMYNMEFSAICATALYISS